jgi:hypothetical protein
MCRRSAAAADFCHWRLARRAHACRRRAACITKWKPPAQPARLSNLEMAIFACDSLGHPAGMRPGGAPSVALVTWRAGRPPLLVAQRLQSPLLLLSLSLPLLLFVAQINLDLRK